MAFDTVGLRAVFEGGSSFISGVQNAARAEQDLIRQTQAVGSATGGATSGISAMGHAMSEAEHHSHGLGGTLKNIATTAAGFAVGNLAMGGISKVFNMAKDSVFGMNSQLETSQIQFETLFKDADRARDHVKMLFEFAKKTPFETQPIIEASRMLQTFGGDALNTQEMLTLVGDAAAGTTTPINELSFWIGRAYSAIKGGQPFGEAAMRLSELAVLTPETRQKMEELQKAGADTSEIWKLMEGDLGRFTGGMVKQAGTWTGVTSTFQDTIAILASTAFKPFFDLAVKGMSRLNDILGREGVMKAMQGFASGLAGVIEGGIGLIGKGVGAFIDVIRDPVESGIEFLRGAIDTVKDIFGVFVDAFTLKNNVQIWDFDDSGPLRKVKDFAYKVGVQFRGIADDALDFGKKAGSAIVDFAGDIGGVALDALTDFGSKAIEIFQDIDWGDIGGKVKDVALGVKDAFMGVDWAGIGGSIKEAFMGVDWKSVGQSFKDMGASFMSIDWRSAGSGIADIAQQFSKFVELKPLVDALWKALQPVIQQLAKELGPALANLGKAIAPIAKLFGTEMVIALRVLSEMAQYAAPILSVVLVGAIKLIGNSIETVAKIIEASVKIITGILNVFIGVFTGDWDRAWKGVQQIVGGVWDAITAIISGALDHIGLLIKTAWAAIDAATGGALSGMVSTIGGWWNAIESGAQTAWDTVKGIVTGAWDGIRAGIDATAGALKTAIVEPFNAAKSLVSDAWSGIQGAAASGVNGVISILNGFIGGIVRAVNWVLDKLGMSEITFNGIDHVSWGSSSGGGGFTPGSTPYDIAFEKGGTAQKSGVKLVGEGGPELAFMGSGTRILNNKDTLGFLKAIAGDSDIGWGWKDLNPVEGIKAAGGGLKTGWEAVRDTVKDWLKKGAEWVWERALDATGWKGVPALGGMFSDAPAALWGFVKNEIIDIIWGWINGADKALPAATGQLSPPLRSYSVEQEFGMTDFANAGAYGGRGHSGIDLGAPMGTPVYAADGGDVRAAGWNGGYGNYIRIAHGALETAYGHLSRIIVTLGEQVQKLQHIGDVGSTGYSTGPHLHFETYENGALFNPRKFVQLADGGIVTTKSFATVGEAGPEAIIPLATAFPLPVEIVKYPPDTEGLGPQFDTTGLPMAPFTHRPELSFQIPTYLKGNTFGDASSWDEAFTQWYNILEHGWQNGIELNKSQMNALFTDIELVLSQARDKLPDDFERSAWDMVQGFRQAMETGGSVANADVMNLMESIATTFRDNLGPLSEDFRTLAGGQTQSLGEYLNGMSRTVMENYNAGIEMGTEEIKTMFGTIYDIVHEAPLPEAFKKTVDASILSFVESLNAGKGVANIAISNLITSIVAELGKLPAAAAGAVSGQTPKGFTAPPKAIEVKTVGNPDAAFVSPGTYDPVRDAYWNGYYWQVEPYRRGSEYGTLKFRASQKPTTPDATATTSGSGSWVGDLSGFASGGMVWQRTLAWLGERGPEAILPMSRWRWTGSAYVPRGMGGAAADMAKGIMIDLRNSHFTGTPEENAAAMERVVRRTMRDVFGREAYLSGARL